MPFFKMPSFKLKPPPPPAPADEQRALSPIVSLIVADLAVRLGDRLLRRGIEHGLLDGKKASKSRVIKGSTIQQTVIGTVLAQVARRSVPGAILVGGGLLAKALSDRRAARKAQAKAALPK